MIKISELLEIYESGQIDKFIKKHTGLDLNEKNLSEAKIEKNWKFLGGNRSNGSNIGLLGKGEKGVIERLTNAIDAVIEKEKNRHNILTAKNSDVIVKKAFPVFYDARNNVFIGDSEKLNFGDARDMVTLVVSDGSKSNKPTLDIVDKGTGIEGKKFKDTILSLNHGNKIKSDQSYLIGAFGQGGSTSLPFTYATIILSKISARYYFTVIKQVNLIDYKNTSYVYMTINDEIPEIENDIFSFVNKKQVEKDQIESFVESESGTFIRMIETDISKRFRENEVTKPGMLGDYINTELFNVALPVKVVDNRKSIKSNSSNQNRYAHGSFWKLKTSKYVRKDYSGSINIEHNNRTYKIDYFVLLPEDSNKWGSESECKKVFNQFNVYCDPILYTVNGQTITTERYTKLNNAGLTFLRYRLLVVVDLDVLGSEKYQFFTTDRARIKETDLTHGFLDSIIKQLSNVEKLKEINDIIAEKSVSSSIDRELLEDISKEIKGQYNKFLKTGAILPGGKKGRKYNPDPELICENKIVSLEITSEKREFYRDQMINIVLTTHAEKYVNESELIYLYVDDKFLPNHTKIAMKGRIQYTINPGVLSVGEHEIFFAYYKNDESMESNRIVVNILNEKTPEKEHKQPSQELDFKIIPVDESSLICDISKDLVNKVIEAKICLETDQLKTEIYGLSRSDDDVSKVKSRIIKPIVLFSLFYGELYDNMEDEEKNRVILSFIKAFLSSFKENDIRQTEE